MTRPVLGKLGPFVGGMNTSSAPSAIGDNELVDCVNFEVDVDGSLVSRPPIVETTNFSATTTERMIIIGSGIIGGIPYVFGSTIGGVFALNGNTLVWSTVRVNLFCRACVQVADLMFFLPVTGSASQGGYWNGTAFTADASMPYAESAIYYKQRIWTTPGYQSNSTTTSHQLRYTEPINPAAPTPLTWTATNSIAVSPGDGQKLIDLQIYNDNLLLFKQDSTYVFAFDVLPSDGAVKAVNLSIGASTVNCVASHDNSSYVYHEGSVYEIVNYTFTKLNIKLPFVYDISVPAGERYEQVFISVVGDRLVVRYYNRVYVYAIRTKTWSRWISSSAVLQNFGPLVEMQAITLNGRPIKYFAGSSISTQENVMIVQDGFDSVATEAITCSITTKNYDFGQSSQFKKLAWWGADVLGVGEVDGTVSPVALSGLVTWEQLHTYTWSQLGTWQILINTDTTVTTEINTSSVPQRMFLKFLKALRFRQANFNLVMSNDGTTLTGPSRIYSLTIVVGIKQLVTEIAN